MSKADVFGENRLADTTIRAYRYRWVIIGVLWTAYIVVFMYRLSIGPLAPFIKEEMGLSSAQIGALMSAASFGHMLSIIPAGWAVDRMGIRRLLVIGEVVGGIFMLVMFLSPSYGTALVIMTMAGLGCGCLMPSTTKGVMVWFPIRERATIMGFKQTGVNVGGVIAAAILPAVALAMGWRFGFLFLGILAIIIGISSFFLYKDPPLPVMPSVRSNAASADVTSPVSQSFRQFLKAREIWLVAFASFAMCIVEFALIAHLVLYLTEALFFPVVTAGMVLAVTQVGGIFSKPGAGFISDRFFGSSRRKVFMLMGGITWATATLIAFRGASLGWVLYPVLFLLGTTAIGWGGVQLTLAAELAGTELAGRATSIVGVFTMAGSIVGPILFGRLVDISGSYQPAWLTAAIFAAISTAILFFVREERRVITY